MTTSENLAFSIMEEKRGVSVLLWNDQDDLVRALIVLLAAIGDMPIEFSLVATEKHCETTLRKTIEKRQRLPADSTTKDLCGTPFWIFFIQQAVSRHIGPWLNGWRRPLSESPGTLLVVRQADFNAFQHNAPDLASYIGSQIYDASNMLSVWSKEVHGHLSSSLPSAITMILKELPGTSPDTNEIDRWIVANAPGDGEQ